MVGGGPERIEQPRDDEVRLRPRTHADEIYDAHLARVEGEG